VASSGRVRADLDPALRGGLPGVQRALVRGLEALGDPQAALLVARQALAEARPWPSCPLWTGRTPTTAPP